MEIKSELILNTEVNKNNRRYPIEVLQSIAEQINSRDRWNNLGILGHPESEVITLGQVAFNYSNAEVREEALYCDIEIIPSYRGDELKQILGYESDGVKRIVFRPCGQGTFKGVVPEEVRNLLNVPNVISEDYKLLMITAIPANEDSLNV